MPRLKEDDENLIVIEDTDPEKKVAAQTGEPPKAAARNTSRKWIYLIILAFVVTLIAATAVKIFHQKKSVIHKNIAKIKIQLPQNYTKRGKIYKIRFFDIQHSIFSGNIKKAIGETDKLSNGDSAMAYSLLGRVFYNKGNYSDAALYFRKSMLQLPRKRSNYYDLMLSYIKLGEFRKAGNIAAQASNIIKDKNYTDALSAMLYLAKGNYDNAINIVQHLDIKSLVKKNDKFDELFGTVYLAMGKYKIAKSFLKKSLSNHKSELAKHNLALISIYNERPNLALSYLDKPGPKFLYSMAILHINAGDLSGAVKLFEKSSKYGKNLTFLKIYPRPLFDVAKINNNFMTIIIGDKLLTSILPLQLVEKKNALKIANLYRAIGINKLVISKLYANVLRHKAIRAAKKANIYYAYGQYAKAVNLLEAAHKDAPDEPIISYNLSLSLMRVEKVQKAISIIEEMVKSYPNFPFQYLLGAIAEVEVGNFDRSNDLIGSLKKLLERKYEGNTSDEINMLKAISNSISGNKPNFHSSKWRKLQKSVKWIYDLKSNNKGFINSPYGTIIMSDPQMNLPVIDKYIKLYPRNSHLNYIKAYFLYRLKRFKEAANTMLYKVKRDDAGFHMRLGAIFILANDYKDAYLEFYRATLSSKKGEGYFGMGLLNEIKGENKKMLSNYQKAVNLGFVRSKYISIGVSF